MARDDSRTASAWHWFTLTYVSAVLLAAAVVPALPLHAQGSGRGFLFQRPAGSFTLRGGYTHANAGGDLFAFVTDNFTLGRSAFSGPTVQGDLALRLAPRMDLVLGAGYAGTSRSSEYRRYVDQNNQPIQQTTAFQRVPLTASVRAYLTPRGRSVGSFAWIPARLAPYVGAGAGAVYYRFRQQGDFVDFKTNNVFTSTFTSSGWAPAGQALAGVDYTLSPRLALTGEAKYIWARGKVQGNYTGFRSIDLSGLNATVGLSVRF